MNQPSQCPFPRRQSSERCALDSNGPGLGGAETRIRLRNLIQRNPSIGGFTLVELTIVVLILTILLAVSIPRLGHLTGHNLKVGCRRLSGTV
jgi:prepilin-type N-terminal cleavage/methylation domain-containing protein